MREFIEEYFNKLKTTIDNLNRDEIETFIKVLVQAKEAGKTVFIMGNGGSAATASHFCCDFNKGVSYGKEKKFKFICLNDNVATMMAYANDMSYEDIFVEQLKNFIDKGDVVIGISGSGNSKNVLKAIDFANSNGGITIGITGYDGGQLRKTVKYSVNTNINDMQISEDVHMVLDHLCSKYLMK